MGAPKKTFGLKPRHKPYCVSIAWPFLARQNTLSLIFHSTHSRMVPKLEFFVQLADRHDQGTSRTFCAEMVEAIMRQNETDLERERQGIVQLQVD